MFARTLGIATTVGFVVCVLGVQAGGGGKDKKYEVPKDAIAGTVKSVDAATKEVTIEDTASHKPLVVKLAADTRMKKMPEWPILFVGEAPGANEDLKGEPFDGAAGKILNDLLASASSSGRAPATAPASVAQVCRSRSTWLCACWAWACLPLPPTDTFSSARFQ